MKQYKVTAPPKRLPKLLKPYSEQIGRWVAEGRVHIRLEFPDGNAFSFHKNWVKMLFPVGNRR